MLSPSVELPASLYRVGVENWDLYSGPLAFQLGDFRQVTLLL